MSECWEGGKGENKAKGKEASSCSACLLFMGWRIPWFPAAPPHLNHHQNRFGRHGKVGMMMAAPWLKAKVQSKAISVLAVSRAHLTLACGSSNQSPGIRP
jgi:hypothetical protein